MRKAGYNGTITELLRKRIQLTRYQSTLFSMHYSDYVTYVRANRGSALSINGAKPANYWLPNGSAELAGLFRCNLKIIQDRTTWDCTALFAFRLPLSSNVMTCFIPFFKFIWFWRNKKNLFDKPWGSDPGVRQFSFWTFPREACWCINDFL